MSMLVQFSVVPLGNGASLSPVIAEVLTIVDASNVPYKATPMGTVLEGDWDTVMPLVRKCHDIVMKNSERALTTITIDDRTGQEARMDRKLASVEEKLGKKLRK